MLKFFKANNLYLYVFIVCQVLFSLTIMHYANQGYSDNNVYSSNIMDKTDSLKVMAVDLYGRTTNYWKMQQLEEKAKQGNLNAQITLAEHYFRGDQTERDLAKSLKWFSLAAAKGDNYSQKMVRVINNDNKMKS